MIRVLVADDQELVREGFATILDLQPDIEVVASVADGSQALASARSLRPDVVLMDVRMPVMDGIEATRRILQDDSTQTRVLVLTTFDNDEYVFAALGAGASGFVLKDTPRAGLIAAIRAVAVGETLLSPGITHRLVEKYARRQPGPDVRRLAVAGAEPARARRREADRPRHVERRDRSRPRAQRGHGEVPRRARAHQDRAPRPRPGGGARLRDRVSPNQTLQPP